MADVDSQIREVLTRYAASIRSIRADPGHSPETSLYGCFEDLLAELAVLLGHDEIRIVQQYRHGHVGSPDFALRTASGTSFVEAKAPGTNLTNLTGADERQFARYMRLGNILYTNYHELRLFQSGELVSEPSELVPPGWLEPEIRDEALVAEDLSLGAVRSLFSRFFTHSLPRIRSIEDLATVLAHATWLVRSAVEDAMSRPVEPDEDGPLQEIHQEFRDVLFYELDEEAFADAYAQTLAYGLLLARQATDAEIERTTIASFVDPKKHRLLSATLRLLSQPPVLQLVGWTIDNLIAVVNQVESDLLERTEDRDPLLYFYEDFLREYDPDLRKDRGVYYTPVEIVDLQTRAIDHIIRERFGKRYGFADEGVKTLDPGVGTGTYLVSALHAGCERVEVAMGEDSVPDAAASMAARLHGFEILVGPYTVAHFRLLAAVQELGARVEGRIPILLTDTLLPPGDQPEVPTHFGFMSEPLNDERKRADRVKQHEDIMVVLGNPPYRRTKAKSGWVWNTLMEDFKDPVRDEYSIDFKNLAELSIWFHRWAHWKLFESDGASGRGVLSFISNRSYLVGGAYGGMRQVYRRSFDELYVIDLHGDQRAPLPAGVEQDENVFDIQVGVAIVIGVADGSRSERTSGHEEEAPEAEVKYFGDTWGTGMEKLRWLRSVESDLRDVAFTEVQGSGTDPFLPGLGKAFRSWPDLREDVFAFSISGIQTKRDHLVVAPTRDQLSDKIRNFLDAPTRRQADLFHETRDKKAGPAAGTSFVAERIAQYAYRPFDRQYLYDHPDFVEYNRATSLQRAWGEENLALMTLPSGHGAGPAVFAHSHLPDMHAFRGSYGGYVFPLWNEARDENPDQLSHHVERVSNFSRELIAGLANAWGEPPDPERLFAYMYAVLSAPSYTLEFTQDLARSFPRIPFPRDRATYEDAVGLGEELLALHTFEEAYPADGSLQIVGSPESIKRVEYDAGREQIVIGEEAFVGPVSSQAWNYRISGYEVLREWIERRQDLAEFTLELRQEMLDVIWAVERTVRLGPDLDSLLSNLLSGGTLTRDELGFDA